MVHRHETDSENDITQTNSPKRCDDHLKPHRIIWFNPLAGHEGFTPEARGMAAALPYVDELVAGGTARNLEEPINLLQESQSAQGAAIAS